MGRVLKALVVLGAVVMASGPSGAEAHPHRGVLKPYTGKPPKIALTADDVKKLKAGESVLKQVEAKDGGRGMAIQDIAAPPDVVWGRILDFKAYPKMVDNVKECEVYEKKGDHIKTRFVIGAVGLSYEYFIDHVARPKDGFMTWTLDYDRESEFDDSVGYWFVERHPDDDARTRLYYSVDLRITGWVPGFIEDMLREEGLRRATQWVKLHAEKAHAEKPAKPPANNPASTSAKPSE